MIDCEQASRAMIDVFKVSQSEYLKKSLTESERREKTGLFGPLKDGGGVDVPPS